MSVFDRMETRSCPVCGAGAARASVFLDASFDAGRLTEASFASRKTPEFMSYRLMRCLGCRTVYAAAAPPPEMLANAYAAAGYDSAEEASLAADTYAAALAPAIASLPHRERALEIGTGTGALLQRLLRAGFVEVVGVEPSRAAIRAASPEVRDFIREGVFSEAGFKPESFDLICCFQTLEHVPDPRALARSCERLLRPGGMLALVTHDYTAPVNRLLGRRSPIIDIEHLQLFCRQSLDCLLRDAGLRTRHSGALVNRYPLRYWLRLMPFPGGLKRSVAGVLRAVRLDRVRIGLNVGNLLTIGRKPAPGDTATLRRGPVEPPVSPPLLPSPRSDAGSTAGQRIQAWLLVLRFGLVGLLNTGFGYTAFACLSLLGAGPGAALVGSTVAGVAFNFQSSRRLVFRSGGNAWRFVAVYAVIFALNWVLLTVLRAFGLPALAAQALLILPIAALSFLGQRSFVFGRAPRPRVRRNTETALL